MPTATLLACPECDLLHRLRPLAKGERATCARCGTGLRRGGPTNHDRAFALYLVALVLFLLANASPLLKLHLHGVVQEATLGSCARILAAQGWPWLSAILITTVILAPLVHFAGVAYVLFELKRGGGTKATAVVFRLIGQFRAWEMAEVFVLGILVSYVKLSKTSTVLPGPSLVALLLFVLAAAAAVSSLNVHQVWEDLGDGPAPALPPAATTARGAGLVACGACGRLEALGQRRFCSRCGSSLHSRKPRSRGRTWALLATAALLYIPANALPVMRIVQMGRAKSDTILSGILYFLQEGSWSLALLIFVASVLVPLVKLVALSLLLLSERGRWTWSHAHRAWLYRVTEAIGRWSMVDIFVITLMVAMVEMGNVASVAPGPGAMAFAMMVVATMLAVNVFDPRLLWDSLEPTPLEPSHG
ncbi:MAG: PqiA/YebS family transporter subunit [Acidobacteria bacterium]|nr:PqiA/YebS family transporter subunit [Acidobacteriota bacterium]